MITQTEKVLSSLLKVTEQFENDAKVFLNSFDTEDVVSFTNNEEKKKAQILSYCQFSLKVKKHIEAYEEIVSMLSLLIRKADNACDAELTKKLSYEFERYTLLFKSVKNFINNCESTLANKNAFKQGELLQFSRELLTVINSYKNGF